jgi:predicted dehydrogenase
MSVREVGRREFLKRGAAAVVAPYIAAGWGFGAEAGAPPSAKVRVAHIGLGGRGSSLLDWSLGAGDVEVSGLCDVDRNHLGGAEKRVGTKVETGPDYRTFLDRKDIDAVVIATPDHWHALMTIDAVAAGKDVYVEKPLCTHVAEGRAMVEAARKHARIVQVGIHHRSEPDIRGIAEIVRSGRIGKVRSCTCWVWENPVKEPTPPPPAPPPYLDYDRWLGPAPLVPYHPDRVHFNFRWCRDYAGGFMTDWGVHMLNVVTLAMDLDAKGPETVEATATFAPKNIYDFPIAMDAKWEFKDPEFNLRWIQPSTGGDIIPGERYGMTFYGEAGQLRTMFGGWKFFKDGKEDRLPEGGKAVDVPASPGHYRNWVDSIRSRKPPIADVEIGHRTTALCQIGNIAMWTKRKLRWDRKAERFPDDAEANGLLSRENRAPYRPRGA